MKKLFTFIAATMLCVGAQAQTVNIHFKNGATAYYSGNEVEYVDFNEVTTALGKTQRLELGSQTYEWAQTNIGANEEWEYGYYFCWGQARTSCTDDISDGIIFNEDYYTNLGLNNNSYIRNGRFDRDHDAACVAYNSNSNDLKEWHTPTAEEFNLLVDNCTVTWETSHGVSGKRFTDKNGNSIFIPAAGMRSDGEIGNKDFFGSYWSSTFFDNQHGCGLNFESGPYRNRSNEGDVRWYGRPIRACKKIK